MGLITYQNLENGVPATASMFNERFGAIVNEINGGLDGSNFKPGGITMESISTEIYSRMWPIGSVYENADDDTNPSILLGFGTWVPFAEGRTTVGKAASGTFDTIGKLVGTESETLTLAQTPAHSHSGTTSSSGNHTHGTPGDPVYTAASGTQRTYLGGGSGQQLRWSIGGPSAAGAHSHSFTTDSKGSGEAHNNIQPSVVTYKWKRTA